METYLDQFEDRVEELAAVRPAEVLAFLECVPRRLTGDPEFMTEVTKVALELSWMRWPRRLRGFAEKIEPMAVLSKLHELPVADNFLDIYDSEKLSVCTSALRQSEFRLRAAHGDYPATKYFEKRFSLSLSPGRLPKARTVLGDFRFAGLHSELHGFTLFGRKRSFDPDELLHHEHPDGQRVNVAPSREVRVSREQFSLQLLSPDFALVQNLSGKNPLIIADQPLLDLGEARVLTFPFVVILPNGSLRFV